VENIMHTRLSPILAGLSESEARVVWEAIGQYVDNAKDAINVHDEEDLPKGMDEALLIAESILEKMNAAIAALVE
jgi:hypothetical protein